MTPELPDPAALVAAADTPLMVLALWMLHLLRRDFTRTDAPPPPPEPGLTRTREELAEFKLEVARTYVPLSLIRDLDARLSLHLVRIEEKLEEVNRAATTAAAVSSHQVGRPAIGFGLRGLHEGGGA